MSSTLKIIESEPKTIYKCNNCGCIMRHPLIKKYDVSEYNYDQEELCTSCESDDISFSDTKCKKCNNWLFSGDDAYQINNDIYCTNCVTPIEI